MSKSSTVKQYLNVSYDDRELAKRLGARWDPSVRRWYCPKGSALAKIFAWRNATVSVSNSAVPNTAGQGAPKTRTASIHTARTTHAIPPATNQNFELPLAG